MELISMEMISENEISYLINNINTGIEFEFALFYLLNNENNKIRFKRDVVQHHKFNERIFEIISKTNIDELIGKLNTISFANYKLYLGTQDDSIGPSDLLLINGCGKKLGLSVKYQNNCTLNVSSKYFLSEKSLNILKDSLFDACSNYIEEMVENYGNSKNWFRTRKNSSQTDGFIDFIRDFVIRDWSIKNIEEKRKLMEKLLHLNSPIDFWVVKFIKFKGNYLLEVNSTPNKLIPVENVILTKESTSYIGFRYRNELFAKMQVKFNNGILEKGDSIKFDFEVNGIKMKKGDPFGSWNFSL